MQTAAFVLEELPLSLIRRTQDNVSNAIDDAIRLFITSPDRARKKGVEDIADYGIWSDFPRNNINYKSWVQSFKSINGSILNNFTRLIIVWIPGVSLSTQHQRARNQMMCSFEAFMKGIMQAPQVDNQRVQDISELVASLVVADILSLVLRSYDGTNLPDDIALQVSQVAFSIFRPTSARKANTVSLMSLRNLVVEQWAVVLGRIGRKKLSLVIPAFTEAVDAKLKKTSEEIEAVIRGVKCISVDISSLENLKPLDLMIRAHISILETHRKTNIRLAQLECLENLVSSIDFSKSSSMPILAEIWSRVQIIYSTIAGWSSSDEIKNPRVRTLSSMLAVSPSPFFDEHYPKFVQKYIFSQIHKEKKRDTCLWAVLRLLRGVYEADHGWISDIDPSQAGRVYSATMRDIHALPTMLERIRIIAEHLFTPKTRLNIPSIIECVDLCVQILLQISAHSIQYTVKQIIPALFIDKVTSPEYSIIGLRALRMMLDETTGFRMYAQATMHNKDQFDKQFKEIPVFFSSALMSLYTVCEERAGVSVLGVQEEPLAFHLYSESAKRDFKRKPIRPERFVWLECLKEVIRLVPYILPSELVSKYNDANQFFGNLVLHVDEEMATICSHSVQLIMIMFADHRSTMVQGLITLLAAKSSNFRPAVSQTLLSQLRGLLEFWITLLQKDNHTFNSLIPVDSWITKADALSLALLTDAHPQIRSLAIQIPKLFRDLEHNFHRVNRSLLDSASDGNNAATGSKSVLADFFEECASEISLRAGTRMSLDALEGLSQLYSQTPLKPQKIMLYDALKGDIIDVWTFCLQEIGMALTEKGTYPQLLGVLRGILKTKIEHFTPLIASLLSEESSENTRHSFYDPIVVSWRNCNVFYLSICGICQQSASPNRNAARGVLDYEFKASDIPAIQNQIDPILAHLWPHVQQEATWARESLVVCMKSIHWRGIAVAYDSLHKWSQGIDKRDNKKRQKARADVGKIVRGLCSNPGFRTAIRQNVAFLKNIIAFISETENMIVIPEKLPIQSSPADSTSPRHMQSFLAKSYFTSPHAELDFYLDHACLLHHICLSLNQRIHCFLKGPIRRTLVPSIEPDLWSQQDRNRSFQVLKSWSGHGPEATIRIAQDRAELVRMESKAGKDAKRQEKKEDFERTMLLLRVASHCAIESLYHLDVIFVPKSPSLDDHDMTWCLASERLGYRVLRPLLSFSFDTYFQLFLDATYSKKMDSDATYFFDSICDQYLPFAMISEAPPFDDSSRLSNHLRQLSATMVAQERLANGQLSRYDEELVSRTFEKAGKLLNLGLFNLRHRSPAVRSRAFLLIYKLTPTIFGKETNEKRVIHFRVDLDGYKECFSSSLSTTLKANALEISSHCANRCAQITESVFAEAFLRLQGDLGVEGKRWILEYLAPWCDNISLGDGFMSVFTPEKFMRALFDISVSIATNGLVSEIVNLWTRLARPPKIIGDDIDSGNSNLHIVSDFLFHESFKSTALLPFCKAALLSMYTKCSEVVLRCIVKHLSFASYKMAPPTPKHDGIKSLAATHDSDSMKMDEDAESVIADSISDLGLYAKMYELDEVDYEVTAVGEQSQVETAPGRKSSAYGTSPHIHKSDSMRDFSDLRATEISGTISKFESHKIQRAKPRKKHRALSPAEAAVNICTDLFAHSFQPFFPHLHMVFNYIMLHLDVGVSPDLQDMRRLLRVILSSLLLEFQRIEERTGLVKATESINIIRSLSSLMGHINTITLTWTDVTKSSSAGIESKSFLKMDGSELVCHLIELINHISPKSLDNWASESLKWATECVDLRKSIKAHQIYRNLLAHIQEPSVLELMKSLEKSLETLAILSGPKPSMAPASDPKSSPSESATQQPLAHIRSILHTFNNIIAESASKQDLRFVPPIFWTTVSMLQARDAASEETYEMTIHLLAIILAHPQFLEQVLKKNSAAAETLSQLNSIFWSYMKAFDGSFRGVVPILYKAMLSNQTLDFGISIIVFLWNYPSTELVDTSPDGIILTIFALLPWFYLRCSRKPVVKGPKQVETQPSTAFAEFCRTVNKYSPLLASIVDNYTKGQYDGEPDRLMSDFVRELGGNVSGMVHRYSKLYHAILVSGASMLFEPTMHVMAILMSMEGGYNLVEYFSDSLKYLSLKASGPAQNLSVRLLSLSMSMDSRKLMSVGRSSVEASAENEYLPKTFEYVRKVINEIIGVYSGHISKGLFVPKPVDSGPATFQLNMLSNPAAAFHRNSMTFSSGSDGSNTINSSSFIQSSQFLQNFLLGGGMGEISPPHYAPRDAGSQPHSSNVMQSLETAPYNPAFHTFNSQTSSSISGTFNTPVTTPARPNPITGATRSRTTSLDTPPQSQSISSTAMSPSVSTNAPKHVLPPVAEALGDSQTNEIKDPDPQVMPITNYGSRSSFRAHRDQLPTAKGISTTAINMNVDSNPNSLASSRQIEQADHELLRKALAGSNMRPVPLIDPLKPFNIKKPNVHDLMNDPRIRPMFESFVESFYDSALIRFYDLARSYEQETDVKKAVEKAQDIISSFFSINSIESIVSINGFKDHVVREHISNVSNPPVHLFRAPYQEVLNTLRHDVLPAFLLSPFFQQLNR
eukprot:TRINITY_DN12886_c0_g1_i1.p1 TRINITY_DN12886_c0_g1~~TRINITY_DN12886_c0_g1_i1.p1  ORF type:complete len:2593 (+),score=333.04 TRINITY_DN12886_c0_g1_i1:43-7821(+)